jgi:Fe-S cluster assembly protein SufD
MQTSLPSPSALSSNMFNDPDFFRTFAERRSWEPGWLADFRKESWEKAQELSQHSIKDENWRFSPKSRFSLSRIQEIANPKESLHIDDSCSLESIICENLDGMILDQPNLISSIPNLEGPRLGAENIFLWGNCFAESGYYLKVPKSAQLSKPITFNFFTPPSDSIVFHKNMVELEPFAEAVLIEKISSVNTSDAGTTANLTHIHLGEGAKLHRIVIQECSAESTHFLLENFQLDGGSSLHTTALHLGSSQTRVESRGNLNGEGADFSYNSLFLGQDQQLFDQRTLQHHSAPHCLSNLLCKNALFGESRSVFSGLIKVDESAQHTDAYQTNRNLLLNSSAEANSLPGLEILANEVKCSHGATTSRIDEQELYYLQSRGIPRNTAERMISLGFLTEVIQSIASDSTKEMALEILEKNFSNPSL